MPYSNSQKTLVPQEIYHLYARGVNKSGIFREDYDYNLFCYLLKKYLTPKFKEYRLIQGQRVAIPVNTVSDKLELYAYCLMPNHFHLLVKNVEVDGVPALMRRVLSNYVKFFNNKYDREGPLIQGSYRGVRITNEYQLIHVSRYIHLNPVKSGISKKAADYKYTSFHNYLKNRRTPWLCLHKRLIDSTDYSNIETYLKDINEDKNLGITI